MRLVSQDRRYDLPYNRTAIITKRVFDFNDKKEMVYAFHIIGVFEDDKYILGEYSSQEKADHVLNLMRETYTVSDDYTHVIVPFPDDNEVLLTDD